MHLEIDLKNGTELLQAKQEIESLLSIVDFAISICPPNLYVSDWKGHMRESDKRFVSIMEQLPEHFSTTDILLALGNEAKDLRGSVKEFLRRALRANIIRIVEKGRGRRSNVYSKIPLHTFADSK